jgi:ankyrin repeat protein
VAVNQYIKAIQDLDIDRVKMMIEKNPKWINWAEPSGKNAIHYLCGLPLENDVRREALSLEILKFLVKKGMDLDAPQVITSENCDEFPATPLWYAYTHGRNKTLYKYLLRQGAEPNGCWWAIAWYDDIPAAKTFIAHGADIHSRPGLDELFVGSFGWKKYGFAYWLLKLGANINAADRNGNTALIMAVKRKDEQAIKKLVNAGADADHKNTKGESARSIAAAKGPKRLLNLL